MAEGKPFFGGIPTDIDVRRMRDAFPSDTLTTGKIISYEDAEKAIGSKRKECRFRTVTNRWRKLMENELEIVIGCKDGVGFVVKDDHDKVDIMGSKLRTAAKASRRALVVGGRVDTKNLTEEERKQFRHSELKAGTMLASLQIRKPKSLPEL